MVDSSSWHLVSVAASSTSRLSTKQRCAGDCVAPRWLHRLLLLPVLLLVMLIDQLTLH
jgi:hypothetical protein